MSWHTNKAIEDMKFDAYLKKVAAARQDGRFSGVKTVAKSKKLSVLDSNGDLSEADCEGMSEWIDNLKEDK